MIVERSLVALQSTKGKIMYDHAKEIYNHFQEVVIRLPCVVQNILLDFEHHVDWLGRAYSCNLAGCTAWKNGQKPMKTS